MNFSDFPQYAFYLGICLIAGAGEYLHLAPMGTMIGVLGLVTGHFFGNGSTKQAVNGIMTAVQNLPSQLGAQPAPQATLQTQEVPSDRGQ